MPGNWQPFAESRRTNGGAFVGSGATPENRAFVFPEFGLYCPERYINSSLRFAWNYRQMKPNRLLC